MFEKFFSSEQNYRFTLTTGALLILAIPVGIACIVLGFIIGENPCIMCWDERSGMIYLGVLLLFMLRYGLRMKYLAAYAFWCFFGIYMGLRHTGNLIWRDLGQGFGSAILGAHTYSWAVFVYWAAVFSIILIVLFIRKNSAAAEALAGIRSEIKKFGRYTNAVTAVCLAVILLNAFQAFLENGVPPYLGKGRPARVTLDLSKAAHDWDGKIWGNLFKPTTLRGIWGVEKPYIAGVSPDAGQAFSSDPASGPIALSGEALRLEGTFELPFESRGFGGKGAVTGIAWDETSGKFAFVTNNAGIYYTDHDFARTTDSAILDYPNGNDIVDTIDATFMGSKLIASAYNKTIYATELIDPAKVDGWWQWRIFREATPGFAPVWGFNRPWLSTARAHRSFVSAAAYDASTNSLYETTVPNRFCKDTIFLAFDMADREVVSERILRAADGIALQNGRKGLDYYITGAVSVGGKVLAVSRNYLSLLVIDPASARVEKAIALPEGIADPHSLTAAQGSLYLLDRRNGSDVVCKVTMHVL